MTIQLGDVRALMRVHCAAAMVATATAETHRRPLPGAPPDKHHDQRGEQDEARRAGREAVWYAERERGTNADDGDQRGQPLEPAAALVSGPS